jgi:hypothetical protein
LRLPLTRAFVVNQSASGGRIGGICPQQKPCPDRTAALNLDLKSQEREVKIQSNEVSQISSGARKILFRGLLFGMFACLLASQNFAQNAFDLTSPTVATSIPATEPSVLSATSSTQTAITLPTAALSTTAASSLPLALNRTFAFEPAAPTSSITSLSSPSAMHKLKGLHYSGESSQSQSDQAQQSTPPKHHVRAGFLILGIAGAAIATLGVIGYAEKAPIPGTIFFAPGAAMAGFGFFFAFHHHN